MKFQEALNLLLVIFPDCEVGEDNDGQLLVYTGLRVDDSSEDWDLVEFGPYDDEQEV